VKSLSQKIAALAVLVAAGCSANTGNNSVNAGDTDTAIFQPKMTSVSGSAVGLIGTRTIALTFDDGPQRGLTDDLLNYLKEQGVQASFFMVGKNIIGNEYLLQRMSDEGMSLGNHTFDHTPIVKMSKTNMNGVYKEIAGADALISPHLRDGKHIFFRSPGGSWTNLIADAMNQMPDIAKKYIGPVFWDIGGTTMFADSQGNRIDGEAVKYDANSGIVTLVRRAPGGAIIKKWTAISHSLYAAADWDCSVPALSIPVGMCADGYIKEIERRQGGIVLLHDTHPKTIVMTKIILPRLKQLGYKFITLDEIPNVQKFE
jgi:peptidoglycan/xylan/chitin deacetylase (PgdA/CDA1 family)